MRESLKLSLFIFLGFTSFSCCKKEKCPKLSNEVKNYLPYSDGDIQNFKFLNNVSKFTDTVQVKFVKKEIYNKTPCGHPEVGGSCSRYMIFNFFFSNQTGGLYERFEPYLTFSESKGSIKSNFLFSKKILDPFLVNGKFYNEVTIDSIQTPKDLGDPRETVLYYNKTEGLIIARSYRNNELELEATKLN